MRYSQSLVARQYGKAYILEFYDQLSLEDINHIKNAVWFFRRNHNFMSLVSVVTTMKETKQHLIDEIFSHFKLHETLKKIVVALVRHKRLLYFPHVLQDIYCLYLKKASMLHVDISSAQSLELSEINKLEAFFAKHSGKKIISSFKIDPSLIAGIKMQSDLFLWQYSIASKLKKLHQKLIIEG